MVFHTGCGSSNESSAVNDAQAEIHTEAPTKASTEPPTEPPVDDVFDVIENSFYGGFSVNSADGIDIGIAFNYFGSKTIKYVALQYDLLNAVGDPAYDDIKHNSTYYARVVGPFNPNEACIIILDASDSGLYCGTLSKMCLKKIEFEYPE